MGMTNLFLSSPLLCTILSSHSLRLKPLLSYIVSVVVVFIGVAEFLRVILAEKFGYDCLLNNRSTLPPPLYDSALR